VRVPAASSISFRSISSGVTQPASDRPCGWTRAGAMLLRANVLLRPPAGSSGVGRGPRRVAQRRHRAQGWSGKCRRAVIWRRSVTSPWCCWVGEVLGGDGRADKALAAAGLKPFRFAPKEGISFINGTQAQTALLTLLVHDAEVCGGPRSVRRR
jgi:hypothetical protein